MLTVSVVCAHLTTAPPEHAPRLSWPLNQQHAPSTVTENDFPAEDLSLTFMKSWPVIAVYS